MHSLHASAGVLHRLSSQANRITGEEEAAAQREHRHELHEEDEDEEGLRLWLEAGENTAAAEHANGHREEAGDAQVAAGGGGADAIGRLQVLQVEHVEADDARVAGGIAQHEQQYEGIAEEAAQGLAGAAARRQLLADRLALHGGALEAAGEEEDGRGDEQYEDHHHQVAEPVGADEARVGAVEARIDCFNERHKSRCLDLKPRKLNQTMSH